MAKCEHGMMPWECSVCTEKKELHHTKAEMKTFLEANVWDGEDRLGSDDWATFSPDDLLELFYDYLNFQNR